MDKIKAKKIGILTIIRVNNYGAELQAFALQHKLELLGYNAEVIDYPFGLNPLHSTSGESLTISLPFKDKLRVKLLSFVHYFIRLRYSNNYKLRNRNFEKFHQKYTKFSMKQYLSVFQLYEEDFTYDIYCVGSDQVWNYTMGYSLLPYFLDFVKGEKTLMSYASSLGISSIEEKAKPVFKKYLSRFKYLSVRENSGSECLSKLLNRKVRVVLDPTLLLNANEWRQVSSYKDCPSKRFLLLYVVTIKPCDYAIDLAEYIACKKGLQIIRVNGSASTKGHRKELIEKPEVGPDSFVGLIEKADFVITNSFHGTVFSLIFETPFFTVINPLKNNNSRVQNLLEMVHLTNRMINNNSVFPEDEQLDCTFLGVSDILSAERQESISFLKSSIDNDTN